VLAGR